MRTPDAHTSRAHGERLGDIGTTSDATIEKNRRIRNRKNKVLQQGNRSDTAICRSSSMVGALDGVNPASAAHRAFSGWQMPMATMGRRVASRTHFKSSHAMT
jgi:hypothetical protein